MRIITTLLAVLAASPAAGQPPDRAQVICDQLHPAMQEQLDGMPGLIDAHRQLLKQMVENDRGPGELRDVRLLNERGLRLKERTYQMMLDGRMWEPTHVSDLSDDLIELFNDFRSATWMRGKSKEAADGLIAVAVGTIPEKVQTWVDPQRAELAREAIRVCGPLAAPEGT